MLDVFRRGRFIFWHLFAVFLVFSARLSPFFNSDPELFLFWTFLPVDENTFDTWIFIVTQIKVCIMDDFLRKQSETQPLHYDCIILGAKLL